MLSAIKIITEITNAVSQLGINELIFEVPLSDKEFYESDIERMKDNLKIMYPKVEVRVAAAEDNKTTNSLHPIVIERKYDPSTILYRKLNEHEIFHLASFLDEMRQAAELNIKLLEKEGVI